MDGFVSTRGGEARTLSDAILAGTAPDGGLYVPASLAADVAAGAPLDIGVLDRTLGFVDVARTVAPRLFPSVARDDLDAIVTSSFDFEVPLTELDDDLHLLELTHGPTLAFKDFGARFLARLASTIGGGTPRTVLVATSGDTGGAVAAAFASEPAFRVVVLFPATGVSERQRRQMSTLGGNVHALAVRGDFDDCQRLAKEAFADESVRDEHGLMSANSINIGRLLPQSLYYWYAAARLGTPATFVVPSGNLGNLCAGLIAHRMGMPSAGFVAALNANRTFADFLEDGGESDAPTRTTLSTAMDVARPSNLERIRWLFPERDELRRVVSARSVTDAETTDWIRELHARTGRFVDPHTAVGCVAASRLDSRGPVVVLSTAHPAKFPEVVERSTGHAVDVPATLRRVLDAEEVVHEIEPGLGALVRQLESS